MLKMFDKVLNSVISDATGVLTEESVNINKLLAAMETNVPMTASEIMAKLGIKSKETLRNTYLDPAIKDGFIKRTIENKPTRKKQIYYKIQE